MKHQTGGLGCRVGTYLTLVPDCRKSGVTKTILPVVEFKVMLSVILFIRFCKLLTTVRVAMLSGCMGLKCLNGTTPLVLVRGRSRRDRSAEHLERRSLAARTVYNIQRDSRWLKFAEANWLSLFMLILWK